MEIINQPHTSFFYGNITSHENSEFEYNPLGRAIESCLPNCINFLIKNGADPLIKTNNSGEDALAHAKRLVKAKSDNYETKKNDLNNDLAPKVKKLKDELIRYAANN